MKIYISADIEGITGVTHWDETMLNKPDCLPHLEQMTAEVVAACEGALEAGATELWINDAHGSGRNLNPAKLPLEAKLIRGWAPHPLLMMQELDASFSAAIFIGYHARAGSPGSPLAHTITPTFADILINNQHASEFLLNAYSAAYYNVPVAFVSGDQALCTEIKSINSQIELVAVKQGKGNSTINIHPHLALSRIRDGVTKSLKQDLAGYTQSLPTHFSVSLRYSEPSKAYRNSFYPGASLDTTNTVQFECSDYFDVLRLLHFTYS